MSTTRGKTRRVLLRDQPEREPLHVLQRERIPSPKVRRTHGQRGRPPYKTRGISRPERPREPIVIPDRSPPRADMSEKLINCVNTLVQEVQTTRQQMQREVASMRETLRSKSREIRTLRERSPATPLEARGQSTAPSSCSQSVNHAAEQGRRSPRSRSEGQELLPTSSSATYNCERCHSCYSHGDSLGDRRRRSEPAEHSGAPLDEYSPIAPTQGRATQQIRFEADTYQRRRQPPGTLEIEPRQMPDRSPHLQSTRRDASDRFGSSQGEGRRSNLPPLSSLPEYDPDSNGFIDV